MADTTTKPSGSKAKSNKEMKVQLIRSDGSSSLSITLPQLAAPRPASTPVVEKKAQEPQNPKEKRDAEAEASGMYTVPERNGVKLPMKIIKVEKLTNTMNDVGGYREAKLEVIEFVNFLKNPKQYRKLGARPPRGAILYGPPGTGKTLMARATAAEAKVPFASCNAAEFLGSDGVDKLSLVFDEARSIAPCILFFDEIDAIARKRRWGRKPPPLTQYALLFELLCQMDGFIQYGADNDACQVIVLGATNRINNIDEALLRPGRFDRSIPIPTPDIQARYSIFCVHLKDVKTSLDKPDLAKKLAMLSFGLSGAKIMAVCNEAAMAAATQLAEEVSMNHFEQGLDRVNSGLRKKIELSMDEKKSAAFHDAGHLVFAWFSQGVDPPSKVSIIPTADSKVTCSQYRITINQAFCTKHNLQSLITMTLAGKACEELFLEASTAVSADDLKEATKIAFLMTSKFGMIEDLGPFDYMSYMPWKYDESAYRTPLHNTIQHQILKSIKSIVVSAFKDAKTFIKDQAENVEKVAYTLMERDSLYVEDMIELLGERKFASVPVFNRNHRQEDTLPIGLVHWND